eukprot:SAG11_NODE_912_length_6580_cov_2.243018_1_plen_141_part_00
MCWDCHLNAYVDVTVADHIAQTRGCPDDRRFHRSTVPAQSNAYLRVMDPDEGVCPTSAQIITDTKKCFEKNLRDICGVEGIIVPGAGNRRGVTSSKRGSKIPSNLLLFYVLNFLPNLRPVLEPAQNFWFVSVIVFESTTT